jgi:hypothetical protein
MAANARKSRAIEPVDLQTQLEELLDAVWQAEANWRLDDRIDMAQAVETKHDCTPPQA